MGYDPKVGGRGPYDFSPALRPEEFMQTGMGRSLLAGKLIATCVSPVDGKHITVRFSPKAPPQGGGRWRAVPLSEATRCFIDVPGHDLAMGDNVGDFNPIQSRLWVKNDDRRRVNAAIYALLAAAGRVDGAHVMQSTNCFFCGRPLTDPVSIERGIGPVCFGKITGSQHEAKGESFPSQALAPPAPSVTVEQAGRAVRVGERTMADYEQIAERDGADAAVAAALAALRASSNDLDNNPDEEDLIMLDAGQDPREAL
jgi:hypothetical protein